MDDLTRLVAQMAAGGGVLVLIVAAVIYIVRGAVATAVQQAAARELETLRHTLSTELEEKRQVFARELEQERVEAQRVLEQFKAELSLAAETRRHIAGTRVKALGELAEGGGSLRLRVAQVVVSDPASVQRFREECMSLVAIALRHAYLFPWERGEAIALTAALLSESAGKVLTEPSDRHGQR